jgi:hypothetical protein
MKTVAVASAIAAVSLGLVLIACSSSDDDTSSSSSSSSSGDPTTGTPREGGTTSTSSGSEPVEVDTCTPAGGRCLCTCDVAEGTTEDSEKECEQPLQGTGGCPKVCCI